MNPVAVESVSIPCMGHGFRLQWEAAQNAHVLLYPEGMVKLNGPAAEILKLDTAENLRHYIPELRPGKRNKVHEAIEETIRDKPEEFIVLNSGFTVRKISSGEGVERTFQTYSPLIASIEVKRRGDVRRAKLYYLRDRSGKSARIKEKLPNRAKVAAAKAAAKVVAA